MSLFDELKENIAAAHNIDPQKLYEDDTSLSVGSYRLEFKDVFIKQGTLETVKEFLSSYIRLQPYDEIIRFKQKNKDTIISIVKLYSINTELESGFYEIKDVQNKNILLFTGKLDNNTDNIDLTNYLQVLLALTVFLEGKTIDNLYWSSILKVIGPFAIFPYDIQEKRDTLNFIFLAQHGLFKAQNQVFSFEFEKLIPKNIKYNKCNYSNEAALAYIIALQDSPTVDTAFLRLYRVLEVLFAEHYKTQIMDANIRETLYLIKKYISISELDTLKEIVISSPFTFTTFTQQDFKFLFNNHSPENQIYRKITKWLDNDLDKKHDKEVFVLIIYYVRCALVHAKLEKEPFLLGPFSPSQEEALSHLVKDIKELVETLLFA